MSVVGNHGHLWAHDPLVVQQGDEHVAQRAEKHNTARQRSKWAVLPRFGPPRGVKPYSCFGGLMVDGGGKRSALARQGCLEMRTATRV